jgi:hypothetical protein
MYYPTLDVPTRSGFQHNSELEENSGPPHGPKQDDINRGELGSRIGKHARRVPP